MTEPLQLIKYKPEELDVLYAILVECGEDMLQRYGLSHWRPPYPITVMQKNAASMDVFGVHQGNEAVGTFTTGCAGWRHDSMVWKDANHKALYLYKLAIRPIYQGRGWGKWCVSQVERLAKESGCQAVRFDAIARHTGLCAFYRKLGYHERAVQTVQDYYGVSWNVVFFEKILQV